jgi:LysR family pca operon transcriptional activator
MATRRYLDRRLRLQLLRAVDAIDTQRSLLKASTVLNISQPALTKSLHELEDLLQTRLFDRHPRGVSPTKAGAVFVQTARRILADLRRLDEELDELSSPDTGTIALGAFPVTAAGMLPGALTRLRTFHPNIKIRLQQGTTEQLLPHLAAGELDLVVGRLYEPLVPDGFHREPLWTEPLSILARRDHPVFSLSRITVEALRSYELVLPTLSQRVGQEIEHLISLLDLETKNSFRSSSNSFIREMLYGTNAISIMPRMMMVGDLLRGNLCVVPMPIETPDRPAGLIRPHDGIRSAAAEAFVTCLREYVAEVAKRGIIGFSIKTDDAA